MSNLLKILALTLLAYSRLTFGLSIAPVCKQTNEVYTDCGTACPDTCANWQSGRVCTQQCVSGCFCKPDFVRNENGVCVPKYQCPSSSNGLCKDPNESYKTCGTACPVTCQNLAKPPTMCIKICKQGCFCNSPYVRDDLTGKCLPPYLCPQPLY